MYIDQLFRERRTDVEGCHQALYNKYIYLSLILSGYVNGLVMAQYRSKEMAHRFRIEAVEANTSRKGGQVKEFR